MKKLIINVDDVGLSAAINEAARQCYSAGVISGVSIMAGGKYFEDAVKMLKEAGRTEAGAHLTLTGRNTPCIKGTELSKGSSSYPADYVEFMKLYALGKLSFENIYSELAAQIKKIKDSGLDITHLDSHEHVHLFPGVLRMVIKLSREYEVPYIRFPFELAVIYGKGFRIKDLLRHTALRIFAIPAGRLLSGEDVICNDMFLGHFHSGRVDDGILSYMMDHISDGVTELCVHPAVESARLLYDSPWHNNAPGELNALLSGEWVEKMEEVGIKLVSHKESK